MQTHQKTAALAHYGRMASDLVIDQLHAAMAALRRPASHAGVANLIELARASVEASINAGTADFAGVDALHALELAAFAWDESCVPAPMTREEYRADQPHKENSNA